MTIVRIGQQRGDPNDLVSKYLQVQEALRSSGAPFRRRG